MPVVAADVAYPTRANVTVDSNDGVKKTSGTNNVADAIAVSDIRGHVASGASDNFLELDFVMVSQGLNGLIGFVGSDWTGAIDTTSHEFAWNFGGTAQPKEKTALLGSTYAYVTPVAFRIVVTNAFTVEYYRGNGADVLHYTSLKTPEYVRSKAPYRLLIIPQGSNFEATPITFNGEAAYLFDPKSANSVEAARPSVQHYADREAVLAVPVNGGRARPTRGQILPRRR